MDARPRPVCRAAKQLLAIVDNRPLIDLSEVNPSLIKYHKVLLRIVCAMIVQPFLGTEKSATIATQFFAYEVLLRQLSCKFRFSRICCSFCLFLYLHVGTCE